MNSKISLARTLSSNSFKRVAFTPPTAFMVLALSLVVLTSCTGGDEQTGTTTLEQKAASVKPTESARKSSSSVAQSANLTSSVRVELAPFDRFPSDEKFPLVFRFSSAVAPAERSMPDNFSSIQISPPKAGAWSWRSDSQLEFVPLDPWRPNESLKVSLKGLRTSDGSATSKPTITPEEVAVTLPAATVSLSTCALQIHHRAPLIQIPVIGLHFNYYPKESILPFANLTFNRKDSSENLSLNSSGGGSTTVATIQGPKIFRPEAPAVIKFKLKGGLPVGGGGSLDQGIECEIPIDPASWDALAEKKEDAQTEIPLADTTVVAPTRDAFAETNGREPLKVQFHAPWATTPRPHGKAKGLTLDHGLTLEPKIVGIWKSDDTDPATLVFTPKEEWPVGIETTVKIDPEVFPALKIRETEIRFTTPKISARITDANLYTDPTAPSQRKIVASVELSHPPKAGELERLLSLTMRVEPEKSFTKSLTFTVSPDPKSSRTFHIQSQPIPLPAEPGEARITLARGVVAKQGGTPSDFPESQDVSIPSAREVFTLTGVTTAVVRKPDEQLQRVLSLEVSEPVKMEPLLAALEIYLLPDCADEKNTKVCRERESFADEANVFPEVLASAPRVQPSALPRDESTNPNTFLFSFDVPGKREIFVRIGQGLTSDTGFALTKDYRTVLFAEEFPKTLRIMHEGALLSLSGDRQLGVAVRNIPEARFELARILPNDVHHLVSSTYGNFSNPGFMTSYMGLNQLAQRTSYIAGFPDRKPGDTSYTTVDFNRFMGRGNAPRGLFVLTVKENTNDSGTSQAAQPQTDENNEGEEEGEGGDYTEGEGEDGYDNSYSYSAPLSDSRLVLLTDLGILTKDHLSGEHDLFVMSFRTGEPVSGATVKLLGQNGVPLFTETTKEDGRVQFPSTNSFKEEKVPLVYVVEKGEDYSFLPFNRNDRRLNFSRFDTEGVVNREEANGLRALVFSDRGIYRPGEEARFGAIVRRRNLGLAGVTLPLELSLTDPRGVEILRKKFVSSELGLDDFRWTAERALTGTYSLGIYLVRSKQEGGPALLGSTSFRVDEFQPDKLVVKTAYRDANPNPRSGWLGRAGTFDATVLNLFGTPAGNNKVAGTLIVRPWDGTFKEFPGYQFYTPREAASLPQQSESLGEVQTNDSGLASFTPDLSRFSEPAFTLEFAAEAFEKDSGRSVAGTTRSLVSDLSTFVGWKADGGLEYISKGAGRTVSFLALDPSLKSIALDDLSLEVEETVMISALVKQPNGTLSYEATPKRSVVSKTPFKITESGVKYDLDTTRAGDFTVKVLDKDGKEVNAIHYVVHGEGNTTFMADRTAEVGLRLAKSSVLPGEDLEISINTPYTGAGLITIERDRVYASKWFKSNTLSSVQKIKVPADVVGNAYVSVSFVRSLDSKQIFAAPLSYGVKPFTIAQSQYTQEITLSVPERVRPGEQFEVKYHLDDPAKLVLYAVDEGILQFARYKDPKPVEAFMPKRALEVSTYQILDLIMPDHKIVSMLSSPGGDEDGGLNKFKNPFARKRRAPMAFWSGVINQTGNDGVVSVPVPETFNGTVRVIAVAVSAKKVGVKTTSTIAQHDFVVDPQVPYFVSPGDQFEVGATIANTVKGSGNETKVSLTVVPSSGLESVDASPIELTVPEGKDRSFKVALRAKDVLGEQEIRIVAKALGKVSGASETISVRPPTSVRTQLHAGIYRPDKDGNEAVKQVSLARNLYDEKREVVGSISESPLSVGRALVTYLKGYPYGCTEQLISAAFPAVLFGANPELGISERDVSKYTKVAFETLSSRQRADGSFGLWTSSSAPEPIFSAYATHFLIEAKARGLEVPQAVLTRALGWLKTYTAEAKYDLLSQLSQSYALYLRAKSGEVVAKETTAMVNDLDRQWGATWRDSSIATLLAGTYKIMQMDKEASELLRRPPEIWQSTMPWPLQDPALFGAIYGWISAAHFEEKDLLSPLDTVIPVARMIGDRRFNTFNASFSLLGLHALSTRRSEEQGRDLRISAEQSEGAMTPITLTGSQILKGEIPQGSRKAEFRGTPGRLFFYEMSETGFNKGESQPINAGLTIDRELRNGKGEISSSFGVNDKVEVTLFIKAETPLSRMAVVELIPGGFELDLSDEGLANRQSLRPGPNTWSPAFIEVQEDRILFFGDLPKDTATFTYRLKPLSRGTYTVPAPYAEGMYDLTKQFQGAKGKVEVK